MVQYLHVLDPGIPIETFINPSYFAVNAEKSQVFHIGSLKPAYQF